MPADIKLVTVRIAPNNPVFDLPVIVGIEEGLFAKAGLDVKFSATYADRERDNAATPFMKRLKENQFDCGAADSYNVCEWASIDRLERGQRSGNIAALRAAVAAQAILSFDDDLQTPRDMVDVPVMVQELTGSHYTTIQMLESAVGADHVKIENGGLPQARYAALKARKARAIAVMEPSSVSGSRKARTSSPRASIAAARSSRRNSHRSSARPITTRRTRPSISSTRTSTNTRIT